MQKFNLHTHTFRCGHASGTDDQMVLSAIEAGFELLGFSDHMPYPELHLPTCRMFYDQRQEYVDSMAKLKVKYQDRIQLRFGYEAEYLEDHQELLEQLHGEVDYLILGQHFKAIETNPAYELVYDYDAYNNDEDVLFYAGQIEKAVATGWFSLIAHPDYFMLGRRTFTPACAEAAQRICAVSAKRDSAGN
ncbi:MAG: PHP domain-containing protein [Holdemania filiformis]